MPGPRIRELDTPTLRRLNEAADKKGYNRVMTDEAMASLDPTGRHIISFSMPHEHAAGIKVAPHRRAMVLMKFTDREASEPVEGMLDMEIDEFNALPEYERTSSGELVEVSSLQVGPDNGAILDDGGHRG